MTAVDKKIIVDLFIENITYGTITISGEIFSVPDKGKILMETLINGMNHYIDAPENSDKTSIIDAMYKAIVSLRVLNLIQGEFRERKAEETIKALEAKLVEKNDDNKKLAAQLADALEEVDKYKPPAENPHFRARG